MNKMSWLKEFAESRKASKQAQKKAVASKKAIELNEEEFEDGMMMIVNNAKLSTAAVGSKIRYKGNIWSLVKVDYSDAKGHGFVLKRVAAIDTKPVTAPAERACTDPGNVYDYDVRATEQAKFEGEANETAQEIAREDAVDHSTTPAARTVESPMAGASETVEVVETTEPVVEDEVAPVEDEAPAEEEVATEDDELNFDDVDAEPVETEEEEAPAEDEKDDDEKEEDKKATASIHKNRIIAAMLKK